MKHIPVKAVLNHDVEVGNLIAIAGWVRSRRTSKGGFCFIDVHDGSCIGALQIVADEVLKNYADISDLGAGCAIEVAGKVVASKARGQDREIHATRIDVVGRVDLPESYPIAKKRHTFEYLRTVAHLRPRTNTFSSIARVRNTITQAIHTYLDNQGFVWVNTPIITSSDCEGAGELFRVSTLDLANRLDGGYDNDFFGRETYLTVSGQLNLESYCLSMSKVYTFGPTFRAENSNTSRHLAEFWMVEPEIAFANLADNADLAENFLKSVLKAILDRNPDDMAFFADHIDKTVIERVEQVINTPFERLDYSDAIAILNKADQHFQHPIRWGLDLQSEHERYLAENHVGAPVIVVNYPKEIKAFYMRLNDDDKTVAAMDVLVPGVGEIIGGSQREERLEVLDARIDSAVAEELWWYRDLRRYGTVPHAGFGLGLERLILYATGMKNIRDVIPFPRVPNSAAF